MTRAFSWGNAVEALFRLALAAGFLSAVADRFGLWGEPGAEGVAWGAWEPFVAYTASLLWFVPSALVPAFGIGATMAEVIIAIGLIVGRHLQVFAVASGVLLTVFALTMTVASGVKAPLDYSVFAAAFGSLYLAGQVEPKRSRGGFP